MILFILKMDEEKAKEICNWKYPDPYAPYHASLNKDDVIKLLNGPYYAAIDESGDLIGFYCFETAAQVPCGESYGVYENKDVVDIGIALRPDLCGIGIDLEFLRKCTVLGENLYLNKNFRLTVPASNKSAIEIYKKFGFKESHSFERLDERGSTKFITMTCSIS